MTSLLPRNLSVVIRPAQYRDLDGIEQITQDSFATLTPQEVELAISQMQWLRRWYGFLKFLSWFPNPLKYRFCAYVAEQGRSLLGIIQVSPFNRTRSTWRIDQVMLAKSVEKQAVGSQLLRHCFESILEARTWLLEVSVNDKDALALYRQNGFQRLAEMTYWEIEPALLAELAQAEPDLPNLLPVSNADAQLLYQLDTASMPPLVRQVFDRNIRDFKTSLFGVLTDAVKQWLTKTEVVSGYVFEPQRKAAIGYFQVKLDRKGKNPHVATLTVHPAYTWLYPELLSQLARITQDFPQQCLQLASSDYQAEREEYLERIGAKRIEHTLVMSRSVWHKLRESKFVSLEGIQWTGVLQGLQPVRKPIPGGMSWVKPSQQTPSDRSALTKSEPVTFKCENLNIEPLPMPESTDTTQEN
ncbi:N-acetyltransferase family protein [Nodularia chucula]|uniref:GNAT family N-acetyltransferase n=1 Tax=Nodularia chucula TaxID=3093667 RepID=UPI0039C5CA3D